MQQRAVFFFFLLSILALSTHAQRPNTRSREVLLRGPYLQAATPTSVVVRWRTDDLTRGVVRYGSSPEQLDKTAVDSLLVTEHKIKLKGLTASTKYYYSIGSWQDTARTLRTRRDR